MMICLQHIALLSGLLPQERRERACRQGKTLLTLHAAYMSTIMTLLQVLVLTQGR